MRDSLEDIRKKYRGTFCFLDLNGKKHLAEYTDDNGDQTFYFKSPNFGEILVDRETIDNCLTYKFPQSGLYNVSNEAVEFVRLPERQWKRAPFRDNCMLVSILSTIGITIKKSHLDISLLNLEEVFKEKYPNSLEEAISTLKYSKALDKNFAISWPTRNHETEILLWFRRQPIGIIKPEEKLIEIVFQPLYQETSDFLRDKEPTWQLTRRQQ